MAQRALPSGDQATGTWVTTPLWSKINNGVDAPDDVDITSDDNTAQDAADFTLTSVTDPEVSTGHRLRVLWHKDQSGGHQINPVIELWQGVPDTGTMIAQSTVTDVSDVENEHTYTLSAGEANSITDYTNLYLRLVRSGDTGGPQGNRRSLIVDEAELEIPDAPAGGISVPLATNQYMKRRKG